MGAARDIDERVTLRWLELAMSDATAFSPDYTAARARFRSSALALGCRTFSLSLGLKGPEGEDLTIDVAWIGDEQPARAVVVSSGLHGVEGYLGAAVQASLLEDRLGGWQPPPGGALILLHALNPWGFAWSRRVNEDNVDLNRNFLLEGERYEGSPPSYAELDPLLNPKAPPTTLDPFYVKTLLQIARHGMPALKDAVAGGQYDFPQGLFYGGDRPSRTQRLLAEQLPYWFARAEEVVHIDVHTGLGRWGTYKLITDREEGSPRASWLTQSFGADVVEPWRSDGVSYQIRGGFGRWCRERLPHANYDVLVAEFGTVHALRVIEALRAENQAHFHAHPHDPVVQRVKQRLRDVFAPPDRAWRDQAVSEGLGVVDRAIEACLT